MAETKEKLDRLRPRRGGNRGVCTKLAKEANELVIYMEDDDHARCEIVKNLLQEKLEIINELDEEIPGLCDIAEIQGEIEESTKVVARILNAIKKIEKAMQGQTIRNTSATSATANQEDIIILILLMRVL